MITQKLTHQHVTSNSIKEYKNVSIADLFCKSVFRHTGVMSAFIAVCVYACMNISMSVCVYVCLYVLQEAKSVTDILNVYMTSVAK